MNESVKNILLWVVIGFMLITLYQMFQGGSLMEESAKSLSYSEFISDVEQGEIASVTIQGDEISGEFTNGNAFETFKPSDANITDRLTDSGVSVTAKPVDDMPGIFSILLSWFPMLLLIGVWIFFMRQMQGGGSKAMGFGKSKAKMLNEKDTNVDFEDVAGVDEAKEELAEVVEFLRDPQKFQRLGGKIPKGVLLVGPPGTGKTLLAKAVAGEAGVPFFTLSGSDFVEMFVGVGASRVRDMFEQGKKNAPCIIFIDELDAVGRHRGAGLGGGNDEREQTLNQMLVEMDGFEANEGVILIAATNRPDVLDPALLRPGRFDRQIVVPNPDIKGRAEILKIHAEDMPLAKDVDFNVIARGTPGFSGADLANLVNEAALMAAREGKRVVDMEEFERAKDKVMMGIERKSMAMSEDEKKLTAYHEAGHAVVALHKEASDPIHKATIIPRGRALGMVMRLPEKDRFSVPKDKLLADLAVAMGGRIAEDMIFGADKITTGASSDIKQATKMARQMVTEWGMSDKLGPLMYGDPNEEEVFLGRQIQQTRNVSDHTAKLVDEEVRRIVDDAYNEAKRILTENKDELEALAQALLDYETLDRDDIERVINGEKPKAAEYEEAGSSLNDAEDSPGGSVPVTGDEGIATV
jgi:cell division protease FtsH